MRYLIGTEAQILAVNKQEAQYHNCSGVTSQWYATRQTDAGLTCLMIEDDKPITGSVTLEPVWEVIS